MADQPVEELDGIHSEGYSDELDRILDDLADRISELEKDDDRWARRADEGRPRAADARRVSAQELFTGAKSRAFELYPSFESPSKLLQPKIRLGGFQPEMATTPGAPAAAALLGALSTHLK